MNGTKPPNPPVATPVRGSTTPPPAPPPTVGRLIVRYVGAFLAALAMQFASMVAVLVGIFVAWAASMEDIHTRADHNDSSIYLTIPIGLLALALWIGSGYVAARISGSRLAWSVIGLIPTAWILLVVVLG